ncbi:MAG TPA: lysylphosphatidylglycerol synthase transmembrane domain-containing protein [Anaerolineae bacterium]|nr:lysylphosphatidylglycerol synthase transmembrane domain-containing protein [Anaerolineae bacterium]HQJ50836.1 lysylphosphatidylglycerol synthase transmembrane domain-containing protein [Anaerolineae bacterium]
MKNWRTWAGVLISLLCISWLVRGTDPRVLYDTLRRTEYQWLIPAVLLYAGGMWVRAVRWQLLLRSSGSVDLGRLFRWSNIGYLINNLAPLRLGDVLRGYLCSEGAGINLVSVLFTLVVERLADVVALVLILVALLPRVDLPTRYLAPVLWIALAAAAAVAVMILVAVRPRWSLDWFDRLARRFPALDRPWLRRAVHSAVKGLAVLGSGNSVAGVLGWSLVAWLAAGLQYYWTARSVGLALPAPAALLLVCLTSLGMVVPASPGSLGVIESITVLTLALFGVGREVALGYALVLRAVSYVTLFGLGLVSLWSEGIDPQHLRQALARPTKQQGDTERE